MVTRKELVDTFGENQLVRASPSLNPDREYPQDVHEQIFEIGLPSIVPGILCMHPEEPPKAFDLLSVQESGDSIEILCLGAPNDETSLRYCVDLRHGFVLLVDTEDGNAEFVNRSIRSFAEFTFRMNAFLRFRNSSTRSQDEMYVDLLKAYLRREDPDALQSPSGWWSKILDYLLTN